MFTRSEIALNKQAIGSISRMREEQDLTSNSFKILCRRKLRAQFQNSSGLLFILLGFKLLLQVR